MSFACTYTFTQKEFIARETVCPDPETYTRFAPIVGLVLISVPDILSQSA